MKHTGLNNFLQIEASRLVIPGFDGLVLQRNVVLLIFHGPAGKRNWYERLDITNNITINCGTLLTLQDLKNEMNGILENYESGMVLHLIIIEDLSSFYWEFKSRHYQEIFSMIDKLRNKYGINIIITNWSNNYERGYNYKLKPSGTPVNLNDVTFVNNEFIKKIDYVGYVNNDNQSYLYLNNWKLLNQ